MKNVTLVAFYAALSSIIFCSASSQHNGYSNIPLAPNQNGYLPSNVGNTYPVAPPQQVPVGTPPPPLTSGVLTVGIPTGPPQCRWFQYNQTCSVTRCQNNICLTENIPGYSNNYY